MTEDIEITSIGIEKLDKILLNGVPRGSTIIVKGPSGSGTELFAKQFASYRDPKEKAVVYFATDEREADVKATMARYRWDTNIQVVDVSTEYFEKVLTREMEASKLRREGINPEEVKKLMRNPEIERKPINFLTELVYYVTTNIPTPYRLVIDSLNFYLEHYEPQSVLSSLRTIKVHTQFTNSITLATMSVGVYDTAIENSIESIADIIIEMEIQRVGSEFETRLVVKKFRNFPNKCAILTFSISEKGITPEMVARVA